MLWVGFSFKINEVVSWLITNGKDFFGSMQTTIINRQSLIDCGLVKQFQRARAKSFFEYDRSELDELEDNVGLDYVNACRKVDDAKRQRVKRCKLRIKGIVFDGDAIFLTLTFNDEILASTSQETRRRYVTRLLKRYCSKYVANIDFGKENGREHYHAIVQCDKENAEMVKKAWGKKCGFADFRKVGSQEDDLAKTTKYINKLNGHCFKDSNHMHRVIYSR